MKGSVFLREFIFSMLMTVFLAGVFLVPKVHATLSYSGGIKPGDLPNTWDSSTRVYIGYDDTGMVSVTGGSKIESSQVHIGCGSATAGTVTVEGEGSAWTSSGDLYVGRKGAGTMLITNSGSMTSAGAYLGYYAGATGSAIVDGQGSSWINSEDLYIGYRGSGSLDILNHATVQVLGETVLNENGTINFGENGGTLTTGALYTGASQLSGSGTVNTCSIVADADIVLDSTYESTQSFLIDQVTVSLVDSDTRTIGVGYRQEGNLTISQGVSLTSYTAYLGYNSGAQGTAVVDGPNAAWTNDAKLYVGRSGTGTLSITNGGTVSGLTDFSGAYLGYYSGSTGVATVEGDGSSWTNSGGMVVGRNGTGILTIAKGGKVSDSSAYIGHGSYAKGSVSVDGEGSAFTSSWNLMVGYNGEGSLSITNAGEVSSGYGSVGRYEGSFGTVSIDGEGSSWTINRGSFLVGDGGTGILTITNGGSFISLGSHVGYSSNAVGRVYIDGKGSSWISRKSLSVGGSGTGSIDITNAGSLWSSRAVIGSHSGATGTVTVNGQGSSWTNSSDLSVESSGSTLAVSDGGRVTSEGASIGSGAVVSLDIHSSFLVGTADNEWGGTITNDGTIRLAAGAGADTGTYTPISFGEMSGDGIIQAMGGLWDADTRTVTVFEAVNARGETVAAVDLDLSENQRALVLDTSTGMSAGAAFTGTDAETQIQVSVAAVTGGTLELLDSLTRGTTEQILSAWQFSVTGYTVNEDRPVYLSLDAASASDLLDLSIWVFLDGSWEEYDPADLSFDGAYASFTATGLGTFAVTSAACVPLPGAMGLFCSGLIFIAGISRRGGIMKPKRNEKS